MDHQEIIDTLAEMIGSVTVLKEIRGEEMKHKELLQKAIKDLRTNIPCVTDGLMKLLEATVGGLVKIQDEVERRAASSEGRIHNLEAKVLDIDKQEHEHRGFGFRVQTHGTRGTQSRRAFNYDINDTRNELMRALEEAPDGFTGKIRLDPSNHDMYVVNLNEMVAGTYTFSISKKLVVIPLANTNSGMYGPDVLMKFYQLDGKLVVIPITAGRESLCTAVLIEKIVPIFDHASPVMSTPRWYCEEGNQVFFVTRTNFICRVPLRDSGIYRGISMVGDSSDNIRGRLMTDANFFTTPQVIMKVLMAVHFASMGK